MHAFLTVFKGQISDHVTLMCSMFLGLGLDAYVLGGFDKKSKHLWVLNKRNTQGIVVNEFWESKNGKMVE